MRVVRQKTHRRSPIQVALNGMRRRSGVNGAAAFLNLHESSSSVRLDAEWE